VKLTEFYRPMKTCAIFIPVLLLMFAMSCAPGKSIVRFEENGRYGFRTIDGEVVTPPVYESTMWSFYNGYLGVKKDGKWGAIDEKGELVIDFVYERYLEFSSDGYSRTCLNGLYGLIDTKGNVAIPFLYDELYWKSRDGLAAVKKGGKWGFVDVSGNIIIPIEYNETRHWDGWNNGWMAVCKDRQWGFIDKENNIMIPIEYYDVRNFSEGLAFVARSFQEWGCIDSLNNLVIPFEYKLGYRPEINFEGGIALVERDRKWGYINKQNETIIPFKYDRLRRFENGYAYAETSIEDPTSENSKKIRMFGYIDQQGNEFLQPWVNFKNFNWQITAAPEAIPDYASLLVKKRPPNSCNNLYDTLIIVQFNDTSGNVRTDTIYGGFWEGDSIYYFGTPRPPKPDPPEEKWTLEKILGLSLTALVDEPKSYPDHANLTRLCISYGLMVGGGNYHSALMNSNHQKWKLFRSETLFRVLSSEHLRQAMWEWIAPYYKRAFQYLHPMHKEVYKDIAVKLRSYINSYDKRKMERYLRRHESKFAYCDPDGKPNPYRKLFAFVDRLILIHKVVTVEEAQLWINKIADDVETW
jgi:hypothetical protein